MSRYVRNTPLLPPASAVEVIKNGPVCLCLSDPLLTLSWLNRLTYGHEIWHRDWPWWYLVEVRWSRSKVKVTRSKTWFPWFSDLRELVPNPDLWCDIMSSHDVMTWPLTSRDVMGRCHNVMWRHGMKTASRPREVQQHFSVFFTSSERFGKSFWVKSSLISSWYTLAIHNLISAHYLIDT